MKDINSGPKGFDGDERRYDDIIDLPHHSSPTRPRMPVSDRAAQFAAFAALSGHGDAIRETALKVEEEYLRADSHNESDTQ